MDVAILGGTGFVGSKLVKYYKKNHANVYLINRGSRKISGTIAIECDRNNLDSLSHASKVLSDVDLIIDCSSYTIEQTKNAI